MHNVEYKCELREPGVARAKLAAMGGDNIATLRQTDTYFNTVSGRLKRRVSTALTGSGEETGGDAEPTEWIHYDRPDKLEFKISRFTIYTPEEAAERFGVTPLPVRIVVEKQREVWMVGQVRVHLDEVDTLGCFLEFEALITKTQNVARAHERLRELRAALAPCLGEPVSGSYADMISTNES